MSDSLHPPVFSLTAIGTVRSARTEPVDEGWDRIDVCIELDPDQFATDALAGLDAFSHAEIVYLFDRVADDSIVSGARHPRGRADWPKIGIFAQRGKNRPNRIGLTACRILGVEGLSLHLEGLDAIDGTPVLDIKPVMTGFLPRGPVTEPDWATEIMTSYWTLPHG